MTYQPTMGQRENLYRVTVTLEGTINGPSGGNTCTFTFDKMDGGGASSKETKFRPGNGTNDELALGGATSIANITVSALMTYDMYLWVPWMIAQCGKAAMKVSKQPLDRNGSPFGPALLYTGLLLDCNPPKTDSESDAAGLLSLVQSSVTPVTAA